MTNDTNKDGNDGVGECQEPMTSIVVWALEEFFYCHFFTLLFTNLLVINIL
jgi:hypothetical protein